MATKKKNSEKQQHLSLNVLTTPKPRRKRNVAPPVKRAGATRPGVHPATPLMKKIAEKAYNPKVVQKSFSKEEIEEILRRREDSLAVGNSRSRPRTCRRQFPTSYILDWNLATIT